jgi:hypothetical protein
MHGAFSHRLRDDLAKLSRCLGIPKPSHIFAVSIAEKTLKTMVDEKILF